MIPPIYACRLPVDNSRKWCKSRSETFVYSCTGAISTVRESLGLRRVVEIQSEQSANFLPYRNRIEDWLQESNWMDERGQFVPEQYNYGYLKSALHVWEIFVETAWLRREDKADFRLRLLLSSLPQSFDSSFSKLHGCGGYGIISLAVTQLPRLLKCCWQR